MKHHGDTFKMYRHYPILHAENINDQGLDAAGAQFDSTKWYVMDGKFKIVSVHDTEADARAAQGDGQYITNGSGNLFGGDSDINIVKGSFPALSEKGGIVNRVGLTRKEVTANIEKFGVMAEITDTDLKLDTEAGLLTRIVAELGTLYAEVKEMQVQAKLIDTAEASATIAGSGAVVKADMNRNNELTYTSIRNKEMYLKKVRCPKTTKVISGASKYGTKTVDAGYTAYVGYDLLPTLQDMVDPLGNPAWKPLSAYASLETARQGEIGAISATRFIEVEDMIKFAGAGKEDGDDDSENDTAGYHATMIGDKEHFDVFPVLYVGPDSFGVIGLEGESTKVMVKKPGEMIPGVDMYGEIGGASIKWWFGFIAKRPERITCIMATCKA